MPRYLLWLVASNNYVDTQGWNFFFGSEAAASPFLFIDMQWTGRGHPLQVRTREQNNRTTILSCQDVAYALTTTLEEESLPGPPANRGGPAKTPGRAARRTRRAARGALYAPLVDLSA